MLPADQRLAVHCMCVLGAMSMRLLTVMILSYQHNTWTHLPTPWLSATTLLHPERPVSDVHVKAVLAAHLWSDRSQSSPSPERSPLLPPPSCLSHMRACQLPDCRELPHRKLLGGAPKNSAAISMCAGEARPDSGELYAVIKLRRPV